MITVRDESFVPDVLAIINELRRKTVEIGIFGDGEDGSFIVQIARVHEYGMTITPKNGQSLAIPLPIAKNTRPSDYDDLFRPKGTNVLAKKKGKKGDFVPYFVLVKSVKIPERSYLRTGYDRAKSKLEKLVDTLVAEALHRKITPQMVYERIGLFLVSEIQKQIRDVKSPPNSEITIKRKKSNNPLVDTGRLRQAITYRVVST